MMLLFCGKLLESKLEQPRSGKKARSIPLKARSLSVEAATIGEEGTINSRLSGKHEAGRHDRCLLTLDHKQRSQKMTCIRERSLPSSDDPFKRTSFVILISLQLRANPAPIPRSGSRS
ncbi:hypothetical protein ACQ4M3_08250 [Leptolyngbya sp. AN03gr2]|uniref:hypothetical protein n=1 Tax=unclassified Leptolyngbya TaxID=2650499 RepID=UPI003D30EFDD